MNKSNLFFIFLLSLKLSALPSLTNRCGEKRLKLNYPENVSVVVFDKECDAAYISPPAIGTVSVDGIIGSTNLNFCYSLKKYPEIIKNTIETKLHLSEIVKEIEKRYQNDLNKMQQLLSIIFNIQKEYNIMQSKILLDEKEIQEQEIKLEDALEKLRKCEKMTELNCDNEKELYNKIDDQIFYDKKKINLEKRKLIDIKYNLEENEKNKQSLEDSLAKSNSNIIFFKKTIDEIEKDALEGYNMYNQLDGFIAGLTFETNWAKNLRETASLNQNIDISFLPMPILKSTIFVESKEKPIMGQNSSLIVHVSIPGLNKPGDSSKADKLLNIDSSINEANPNSIISFGGTISLSLNSACEFVDENNIFNKENAKKELLSTMKINISHTYPIMQIRQYKIRFNPKRILDELESVTEINGFLSKEKIHETIERNITDDLFSINFYNNNSNNGFTREEQAQIKLDAKREIVDKILEQIGAVAQIDSNRPPVPRFDNFMGPRILAPCFGYNVCSAAGFIIETAQDLFGDETASSKFKKYNDIEIVHEYANESPVYYSYQTSFVEKKR